MFELLLPPRRGKVGTGVRRVLTALTGLLLLGTASASAQPLRVILVGDSTMAPFNGYGDALCQRFTPEVICWNLARNGRSSGSFRAEGLWDKVQGLLRDSQEFGASVVLIQFGHNDQPGKPGRSTDLATEFPVNMARYVAEVKALGALPVLVTPLTRRSFRGQVLNNDLQAWADVVRHVAAAQQVPLLDLNVQSAAAVQAMGEAEADTLAMVPKPEAPLPAGAKTDFDRTHLGDKGARLFSQMVLRELSRLMPAVAAEVKPGSK